MQAITDFIHDMVTGLAEFLEREAGHAVVLMVLIWWGYQLMTMHIDFGQRVADEAIGALFYALSVRKRQ